MTVPVEVADTPESRARGLMYRTDLEANAGVLFIFPKSATIKFWMKNTPLPLDMIFIADNRQIVGIVHNARPFSIAPLGGNEPSQFVLEVHAGFAARHGVAVGDAVEFVAVPNAPR